MQQFEEPGEVQQESLVFNSILVTAKVAGIAAIISLLGTIAGVVVFVTEPASVPTAGKEGFDETAAQVVSSASAVSVFFSFVIGVLAFYFLYRFSLLTKAAFKNDDRPKLTTALYSLASYFKIWGIIMFVIIFFFALAFIGGVLGSALK